MSRGLRRRRVASRVARPQKACSQARLRARGVALRREVDLSVASRPVSVARRSRRRAPPPRLRAASSSRLRVYIYMDASTWIFDIWHMDISVSQEELAPMPSTGPGLPAEFQGNYELFAIVTHKGRSADGGHYVSFVRQDSKQWLVFDDETVSETTTEHVMNLKGGGDEHMASQSCDMQWSGMKCPTPPSHDGSVMEWNGMECLTPPFRRAHGESCDTHAPFQGLASSHVQWAAAET